MTNMYSIWEAIALSTASAEAFTVADGCLSRKHIQKVKLTSVKCNVWLQTYEVGGREHLWVQATE